MKINPGFPTFESYFAELQEFALTLADGYHAGQIASWEELDRRVKMHFTTQVLDEMESQLPGWCKMSSYVDGVTLTHVMCIFLGLDTMPEFRELDPSQQGLMKWVILLHDLEKEPTPGKRDHGHAFRSAATAARLLPRYGFETQPEYATHIDPWFEFTHTASTRLNADEDVVQDNSRLPEILDGIEHMFGHNTAATLILKTILFHLSVDMKEWPPANPLSPEEACLYFDPELLPLLRVMHHADTDGWSFFDKPQREALRKDTNECFDELDQLILQRQ